MKKILFLLIIVGFSFSSQAQRRYEEVLRKVEQDNPMLQVARQKSEARQIEAHVGLMLPDPQVELSLFRGDPAEQGTRWDLRVSQSFDMPSVYVRRARLRALREHAAELDYETTRFTLLHEAQLICAELIYANGIARVYGDFTITAIKLMQLYEKRLAQGDCTLLEYNRVMMEKAEALNLASQATTRSVHLYNDLCVLMGVETFNLTWDDYDTVILPGNFDEWYDSLELRNPELMSLRTEVDMSQQELQLNRSKWLPSMSVGYASETVTGSAFRGVTLGMNLPVWSQPRSVKQAKLAHTASQEALEVRRNEILSSRRCLMHHLNAMRNNLRNMRIAYAACNSQDLLDKALEAGEISLEQYLQQLDYYTKQRIAIWDIAFELEKGCINLYSITL